MWAETGKGEVTPQVTYYVLRTMMFVLSFVLEDWAIHELVQSPRQRRIAVILVASSYVTWTYQTHTFSNSVETLLVLWSLVLIQRILENKVKIERPSSNTSYTYILQQHSSLFASALLGILLVFGIFNRITFPAFLLIPGFYLIPHFIRKYVPPPPLHNSTSPTYIHPAPSPSSPSSSPSFPQPSWPS